MCPPALQTTHTETTLKKDNRFVQCQDAFFPSINVDIYVRPDVSSRHPKNTDMLPSRRTTQIQASKHEAAAIRKHGMPTSFSQQWYDKLMISRRESGFETSKGN